MGPSSCLANQINNFLDRERGQNASERDASIKEHIWEYVHTIYILYIQQGLGCADLISMEKALCVQVPSKTRTNGLLTQVLHALK